MILEGLVTTTNADGTPHIAPMGPLVDEAGTELLLRPFRTSTTFANLQRTGVGVFHVTDDVEMLARAAVGRLETLPPLDRATGIDGWVLRGACRWMAFRVRTADVQSERASFVAEVVDRGTLREFFGFNRAKHAVVEAAILATRMHLIPRSELDEQIARLEPWVAKTGGPQERRAFDFLTEYIQHAGNARPEAGALTPEAHH